MWTQVTKELIIMLESFHAKPGLNLGLFNIGLVSLNWHPFML